MAISDIIWEVEGVKKDMIEVRETLKTLCAAANKQTEVMEKLLRTLNDVVETVSKGSGFDSKCDTEKVPARVETSANSNMDAPVHNLNQDNIGNTEKENLCEFGPRTEMVYCSFQDAASHQCILARGTYRGWEYLIYSFGTHPAAYVRIPLRYNPQAVRADEWDYYVDCHGVVTFVGVPKVLRSLPHYNGTYWIGWDYDWETDQYSTSRKGKAYTTDDILKDCMAAIEELQIGLTF